ncbi:MAG: DMT family transporter [Planctomycetia bacterium]|nr:DMT family transporter [Planctomycetia bacterium]
MPAWTSAWWFYALLSAACFGMQYVLLEVLFRKMEFAASYTFLTLANALVLAGIMFALYPEQNWTQLWQGWSVAGLLGVYVLCGSGAYLFNALAIRDKDATHASLLEITYPAFIILLTALFLHRIHLNLLGFLGAALIIGGAALVLYSQGEPHAPASHLAQLPPQQSQQQQP